MNTPSKLIVLSAAAAFLACGIVSQGSERPPAAATPPPGAATPGSRLPAIRYKVPAGTIENMKERISSGTRGATDEKGNALPYLELLVPNHIAHTAQTQPALFWYQSAPANYSVELAVIEPDHAEPMLKATIGSAGQAGLHSFSLRRAGIKLQPNMTYRWSVALVVDKNQRSRDVFAAGRIKCVAPPAGWPEKMAGATFVERAALCGEAGLWYDALENLSAAIVEAPGAPELRAQRAALLKREGLRVAAEGSEKAAR